MAVVEDSGTHFEKIGEVSEKILVEPKVTQPEAQTTDDEPKPFPSDIQRLYRGAAAAISYNNAAAQEAKFAAMRAAAEAAMPDHLREPLPHTLTEVPKYIDKVRRWFRYDPETGDLFHDFAPDKWDKVTRAVGLKGYGRVTFYDFSTSSANVVWLLHKARWPVGRLARRDDDVQNDRIENLYEPINEPHTARALSRSRGVARSGPRHWQAYVRVNGEQKNLGRFKTEAEAIAARAAWDRGDDLV